MNPCRFVGKLLPVDHGNTKKSKRLWRQIKWTLENTKGTPSFATMRSVSSQTTSNLWGIADKQLDSIMAKVRTETKYLIEKTYLLILAGTTSICFPGTGTVFDDVLPQNRLLTQHIDRLPVRGSCRSKACSHGITKQVSHLWAKSVGYLD